MAAGDEDEDDEIAEAVMIDWRAWECLLRERGVILDRPRGSAHPRFPEMIYPLDYGYISGTVGGDGAEVDVFVGGGDAGLNAALITHDLGKDDRELKLLWNTTATENAAALAFLQCDAMRVTLRYRR
ncbi:MAG TPA: inorganic pyrophosphatase [Ktedonobacterales bacterium]